MSDFEEKAEAEAADLRRQAEEGRTRKQSGDAAIHREQTEGFEEFRHAVRRAGALLDSHGAPTVSKQRMHFRRKAKLLGGSKMVLDSEEVISGWVLCERVHQPSEGGKGVAPPSWADGVLFDPNGDLYAWVRDQIKETISGYDAVVGAFRLAPAYKPEDYAARTRVLLATVSTVTARLLARS